MKRFSSRVRAGLGAAAFVVVSMGAAQAAQAAVQFDGSPTSGAPPATLGGFTMVPSPQDTRADGSNVTDPPATASSSFALSPSTVLETVGSSWGSSNWAGGSYAGRVYDTQGDNETINLPSPSSAVYFYAAPDQLGAYQMVATATAASGATASSGVLVVPENPLGDPVPSGQYFGFYGTGGDQIQSISVSLVDPNVTFKDFAIGDFALAGAAVDDDLGLSGMPSDFSVDATTPAGATVTYTPPTAVDDDSPPTATVNCSPASGSSFAIGTTTVTCTATDADDSNSPVSQSFTVTVVGAAQQLSDLAIAVQGVRNGHSLARKVARAEAALAMGRTRRACRILASFTRQVSAEGHRSIPSDVALTLIADARRIQAVIGCGG